jgi:DNA mismatch repair protein MutL
VSRFHLKTAPEDGHGTEIEVRGGKILTVREVGFARGTTVEVAGLFFNLPARRKFLRSEATELSHVLRWVSRFALARPDVRFRLDHGSRTLLDAPPSASAAERAHHLYGEQAGRLLPFDRERPGLRVHGMAGRPTEGLPRRDGQHVFVNGRVVQDRVLTHAIHQAYGNTMARDRFPAVVVFVEIEPSAVDVNVHPQKTEVRFARSSEVHDAVRDAIASALGAEEAVPDLTELRPQGEVSQTLDSIAASAARYLSSHEGAREVAPRAGASFGARRAGGLYDTTASPGGPPVSVSEESPRADRWQALAQYRDSYIVAEDSEGIVLVDQHAAHERVLFEQYLEAAEADGVETQRLMFPVTVELAADQATLLQQELGEFRRLGFDLEPFGDRAFRIDGVPSLLGEVDPVVCLRELLGEAAGVRSAAAGVDALRRKLVTSAACQAAIKINHPLTTVGMESLLHDLGRTANPSTCPHGRPVLFRIRLEEIERGFRRR